MDYIFISKIILAIIIASWGLYSLLTQWSNQHDPEAVGNLILKIGDIQRLINTDNRKDKGYFLGLLRNVESNLDSVDCMDKARFKMFNDEVDSILKFYNKD